MPPQAGPSLDERFHALAFRFRLLRETRFGSFVPVCAALAVIWLWFGVTEPAFLSPRNVYFLFMQSAVVGTLAVGLTVVLLLGEIDLSAAAMAGVCAALLAVLLLGGTPAPLAILAAIALGVTMGLAQGVMVVFVGIPSFVVTLAGLLGFQGLMLKILGIQGAINMRDPAVRALTTVSLCLGLVQRLRGRAPVAGGNQGCGDRRHVALRRARFGLERHPGRAGHRLAGERAGPLRRIGR